MRPGITALLFVAFAGAHAQDTTQAKPTIVLFASASAREVRFATQPNIHVRLCNGAVDSVHVLDRRNLPDPVRPGVTYRDVYVAVEIIGHLNAECLASAITGKASPQCATPERPQPARSPRDSIGCSAR